MYARKHSNINVGGDKKGCKYREFIKRYGHGFAAASCNDYFFGITVDVHLHDDLFEIYHCFFNAENGSGYSAGSSGDCSCGIVNDFDNLHNEPRFSKNVGNGRAGLYKKRRYCDGNG